MGSSFVKPVRYLMILSTVLFAATGSLAFSQGGSGQQSAERRTSAAITAEDVKARVDAFTRTVLTAAAGSARSRVSELVTSELERLSLASGGSIAVYRQAVPIISERIDPRRSSLLITQIPRSIAFQGGSLSWGIDYVPLLGAASATFGGNANVVDRRVVFGGRLGTDSLVDPSSVRKDLVLLLPEIRADGLPTHAFSERAISQVHRFCTSGAVLIASLDFVPPRARDEYVVARTRLDDRTRDATVCPPVVLLSRAAASLLLTAPIDAGVPGYTATKATVRYSTTRGRAEARVGNIVAQVGGSDLGSTERVIVVVAALGMGEWSDAAALLEIAEYIATTPAKLTRPILFVWTAAGGDIGDLGSTWFAEHPSVDRERIAGVIRLDGVGGLSSGNVEASPTASVHGEPPALQELIQRVHQRDASSLSITFSTSLSGGRSAFYCAGGHASFARTGVPTATVSAPAPRRLVAGHTSGSSDYETLSRVARFIASTALAMADGSLPRHQARPTSDASACSK